VHANPKQAAERPDEENSPKHLKNRGKRQPVQQLMRKNPIHTYMNRHNYRNEEEEDG
jgi:hypothetical protein